MWPISQAADSCFGTQFWPDDVAIPQAWVEFEVDNVAESTEELVSRDYRCFVSNRLEPWGQTATRLLGPESLLIGLTETPWLRESAQPQ